MSKADKTTIVQMILGDLFMFIPCVAILCRTGQWWWPFEILQKALETRNLAAAIQMTIFICVTVVCTVITLLYIWVCIKPNNTEV